MLRPSFALCAAVAAGGSFAPVALAATAPTRTVAGVSRDVALAEVRADPGRYGVAEALAAGMVLQASVAHRVRGLKVVHVGLSYGGIVLDRPVAAMLVDPDRGSVRLSVSHGPVPVPRRGALAVPPRLSAAEAVARLKASGLPGARGAAGAEPVWTTFGGRLRLAYRVDPPLDLARRTNRVFLVDARTGAVFVRVDRFFSAKVEAFRWNPVTSPTAEVFDLDDVPPGATSLEGVYLRAVNCLPPAAGEDCDLQPTVAPDANGDFFVAVPDVAVPFQNIEPTDPYAEVSVYYHADKFRVHLENLGFGALLCNQDGLPATVVANLAEYPDGQWQPYDNAFWSGDCALTMAFGQGTSADFGYDGDVVYHEFGHGVVEAQTPGETLWLPRARYDARVNDAGALNEAIADFLSSSFTGDPAVGEYVGQFGFGEPSIRNNDNGFVCPDDLTGQVHNDSEPFAGALWRAYQEVGDALVEVVLVSLTMMPDDCTFEQAAAIMKNTAEALFGPSAAGALEEAFSDRNLLECPRILPWEALTGSTYVFPPTGESDAPPLQLTVDVPAGATDVTVAYSAYTDGSGGDGPVAMAEPVFYARWGAPVRFAKQPGDPVVYDLRLEDLPEFGAVELPDVQAGSTLYFGFGNVGIDAIWVNVDGVAVEVGPGGGTTGTTGTGTGTTGTSTGTTGIADTGGGGTTSAGQGESTGGTSGDFAEADYFADRGCACRAGGRGRPSGPWWWLAAAGVVLRRRRAGGWTESAAP